MAISYQPSKLSLPQTNPGVATVLEYLIVKFPSIDASVWRQRMANGKVHWHDGAMITSETRFQPQRRVYYYREVSQEPIIPFKEKILFQDDHILVAYKPHFLPVMSGGIYVNECLQNRLKQYTANNELQAVHRLDRVTAGLVLFSVNKESRSHYHNLFNQRRIRKTYQAIATVNSSEDLTGKSWQVKNRIVKSSPSFTRQIAEGAANSHSIIRCVKQRNQQALFKLQPITGKTHQLRVHMQSLGWPIANDKVYPKLQPKSPDNFDKPLQLLAKKLEFTDPVTQQQRCFSCENDLMLA